MPKKGEERSWYAGLPKIPDKKTVQVILTEPIVAHLRHTYGGVSRGLRELAERDMRAEEVNTYVNTRPKSEHLKAK